MEANAANVSRRRAFLKEKERRGIDTHDRLFGLFITQASMWMSSSMVGAFPDPQVSNARTCIVDLLPSQVDQVQGNLSVNRRNA